MPQVTVVIPTFDRARLLPRAVDSVLSQKGVDFELIIVDDGSTDDTSAVLERYRPDGRVRILRAAHAGVSAARNSGVTAGNGKYVAFLDSDDEWLPGKLAVQARFLEESESVIVQTEEIWMRKGVRVNPPKYAVKQAGDIFGISLDACMITPSSVMMTRELFEATGGFRIDFPACEDYELWLRIAGAHPVGLIPKPYLTRYGGHADQLSARYPAMDRFRIRAIALWLDANPSEASKRSMALAALQKKLRIYRNGCLKRARSEEVAWCEEIALEYGLSC